MSVIACLILHLSAAINLNKAAAAVPTVHCRLQVCVPPRQQCCLFLQRLQDLTDVIMSDSRPGMIRPEGLEIITGEQCVYAQLLRSA